MKRVLITDMIIMDSDTDSFLVLSPQGKSKSVHEVIVGDTIYYSPALGIIKKIDYPLLQTGILKDKTGISKIENELQ